MTETNNAPEPSPRRVEADALGSMLLRWACEVELAAAHEGAVAPATPESGDLDEDAFERELLAEPRIRIRKGR